jgi:hypothetical protein
LPQLDTVSIAVSSRVAGDVSISTLSARAQINGLSRNLSAVASEDGRGIEFAGSLSYIIVISLKRKLRAVRACVEKTEKDGPRPRITSQDDAEEVEREGKCCKRQCVGGDVEGGKRLASAMRGGGGAEL